MKHQNEGISQGYDDGRVPNGQYLESLLLEWTSFFLIISIGYLYFIAPSTSPLFSISFMLGPMTAIGWL